MRRRNKHWSTINIGSAIHTGGRLQYVHSMRHVDGHTFATIAPAGVAPHTEIRLSGYYSVTPSLAILTQRFLEDDVVDGIIDYLSEVWEFEYADSNLERMAERIRQHYVTFEATGEDYATDPDGSHIIDYATAEREVVSIWPRGLHTLELARLQALVDQ